MSLLRRWPLLAAVVILLILTAYQLSDTSLGRFSTQRLPQAPTKPVDDTSSHPHAPAPASPQPSKSTFAWREVPIRHPVQDLISLPPGQPQRLPQVQHTFGIELPADKTLRLERQASVKKSFQKCFASYKERAWMKDELSPISGGSRDAFGGWAATLVDALDTLHIMGMQDELRDAISAVATIDFSTSTESTVNVFETTIRYLGGFIAAFDLTGDAVLLKKAVEVGEMLLVAFDTPNHMPWCRWEWEKAAQGQAQEASAGTLVSELGSLTVEFTRLSQITQDMRWYDAVARITNLFAEQQDTTHLPGMWPVSINARDMILNEDTWFTLGGMSDSLYEYFPKAYALLGGEESIYRKLYDGSMSASIRHLFFRPMVPNDDDILISGNVRADSSQITLDPQGQHLGCFAGGMLALGGRLFNHPDHVSIGRKITEGCIWAYNASPLGVMPETFHLVPCESADNCQWDNRKWEDAVMKKHDAKDDVEALKIQHRLVPGFTDIGDRRYILRPEAIESVFILYRITGDRAFQDAAWKMWTTISNLTETEFANAAMDDVTITGQPQLSDRMESFWMAETLKYFYLIFSEPELISLDDYILNTEAHPFKRPK
jgi:mannosyl-oligosaccharide alpha-1,2-mannosidase